MIWLGNIDSTTISWNTVIYEFFINLLELFTAGKAVHKFSLCFVRTDQWASGQQCMEVRKAIIPAWNVTRMKRTLTLTVFWEITIKSKLLNQFQWSWYHSFQKTMFYLMKLKHAIFSNIKVTKIERSASFGTPSIMRRGYISWQLRGVRGCYVVFVAVTGTMSRSFSRKSSYGTALREGVTVAYFFYPLYRVLFH